MLSLRGKCVIFTIAVFFFNIKINSRPADTTWSFSDLSNGSRRPGEEARGGFLMAAHRSRDHSTLGSQRRGMAGSLAHVAVQQAFRGAVWRAKHTPCPVSVRTTTSDFWDVR